MKDISSAVLFTNNVYFLSVHPTNKLYWEIPKGVIDDGEKADDAAIREFREETGIELDKSKLHYVGTYPLHNSKDIALFLYVTNTLPDKETLKCKSMTGAYGELVPEIDRFAYYKLTDYTKLRMGLHRPIRETIKKMKGDLNGKH